MADIINTYPVFERNQVLTSSQLNSLVNYLDQQNRLTRTRLIGMGIVCGLELSHDPATAHITISRGTGITSEGYLISMGECVTVKYRDYSLPPGTIYEPFVNENNVQDIELFELLTEDADDGTDVTNLNPADSFLDDKVVLLFLESYDKDLKSCLGKSCDELGKERILTIRKLLIDKTDLQTVWNRTNDGKLDASFPKKFELPVINMPRVLFNPSELHSENYEEFSINYANAIKPVIDDLLDALKQTYTIYRPLLLESYDEENPFETEQIDDLVTLLLNFINDSSFPGNPYRGIQYVYDLFLDLIAAYNEFKKVSFDLMSECTPDMSRFPKHLMLNEAIPPALALCENSEFRHYFVQPPVYNLQSDLLQRTIALHNKIVLMLESFDPQRINASLEGEGVSDIRITPSNEKVTTLSLRSIPWYYDPNLVSSYSKLGRLKDYWNYDVSRKCPLESDGLVLNYEDQDSDQSAAVDKLSTPLFYDIQDYPFLRIEGHISKDFGETVDRINDLKKQFNLPFKTLALSLNPDVSTLEIDYNCGFEDIQEEYVVLRSSFCSFVNDILGLHKFVVENQNHLFDNDDEDQEEIAKYLNRIKDLIDFFAEMCDSMADCVPDFDFVEFQDQYKEMLIYVIDFFLEEMELMNEIEINEEDQERDVKLINKAGQLLFPILYKILDLLFYNRFLRIYFSFKRREYYLRKETSVFSTFIKKHPGIDHQAGVPKGGTFIIVYKGGEDSSVIGDFNLPYLCCNEDRCVPACDEDDFVFEVPPFARPDYAITTPEVVIKIDVKRNDGNILGGDFSVRLLDGSEIGAEINVTADDILEYTPPSLSAEELPTFDHFTYELTNNITGASDVGNVTVLIKEAGEDEGECYSIPILKDWDEKGDQGIDVALEVRDIKVGGNDDKYQMLLDSLRLSCGFTIEEIQNSIFESIERRRNLLNSIPEVTITDETPYEELERLIVQYQRDFCGKCCFSIPILNCWDNRTQIVEGFLENNRPEINYDKNWPYNFLMSLRQTRGFTQEEIDYILEMGGLDDLLICLGIINDGDEVPGDQMRQFLNAYQADNCGGEQFIEEGRDEKEEDADPDPTKKSCYTRDILKTFLGDKGVASLLKNRGVSVGRGDDIYQLLLSDLSKTGGFTSVEINQLLRAKKLDDLLKLLGFKVTDKTKDGVLLELINKYQADNCAKPKPGFTIDLGDIPVKELKVVLEGRGEAAPESGDKKKLEKAVRESKGGNRLSKDDAQNLSVKTLRSILKNKGGSTTSRDNKTVLINKLLLL